MHELNQVDAMFIESLKELGLWEDKELLISLESIYYKHKAQEKEKQLKEHERRTTTGIRGRTRR